MVNVTINGKSYKVEDDMTILDAAASVGIYIPTLCYLKDINNIGACRVCSVEVEGCAKLVAACNNKVWDGMVIHTNSPKVRESRRNNVELILSQHDGQRATCVRSGNCSLQTLANDLGIVELPFRKKVAKFDWPRSFPLIRDESKCIKCMRCVQICDKVQGLNIWDVSGTGSRTTVDISRNRKIKEADCALCGQCITHCPVGALRERDDTEKSSMRSQTRRRLRSCRWHRLSAQPGENRSVLPRNLPQPNGWWRLCGGSGLTIFLIRISAQI